MAKKTVEGMFNDLFDTDYFNAVKLRTLFIKTSSERT